ncbi:preprotein translocase subunit YajC [Ruminiclostridium sufflavum DSM 19573]|uniref:Preprotein translocase subunit YajC n=1 Tax=Ruminiclostridium sufflavum DSM 19573 TaxID=1121337 RepID=A0A318XKF5_9FIRM|nr:preprotein translocase subunit YajC [Ruminiclostridium sufflavum]PYG87016.1 preprotein translocase subunit YajC [Ruminiclostridium sufflavum DSM 19573]
MSEQSMAALVQFVIPLVLLFGLMYLMIIRPQKKKEKKTKELLDSLQVGWSVITIGGICGKIINIKDDEVTVESGVEKTKILIKRWSVKEVIKPIEG